MEKLKMNGNARYNGNQTFQQWQQQWQQQRQQRPRQHSANPYPT